MSKRFTLSINEKALVQQIITILKTWPTKFGSNKAIVHVLFKYTMAPTRKIKPGDTDILAFDFRGVCWMAAQQLGINRMYGYRKRAPSFSSGYFFNEFTNGIGKDLGILLSYIHRHRLNGAEAIAALTDFYTLGIQRNMSVQDFRDLYMTKAAVTQPTQAPRPESTRPLLATNVKIGDILHIEIPVDRRRTDGLPVTALGFFTQKLYERYVKSVDSAPIEIGKVYNLYGGAAYKTVMHHDATQTWVIESLDGKEVRLAKASELYQQ